MKKKQAKNLPKISASGDHLIVSATFAASLLELLTVEQIDIASECGGNATCGTCKVRILNPEILDPPNEIEHDLLKERNFNKNERLACQIKPHSGLKFKI